METVTWIRASAAATLIRLALARSRSAMPWASATSVRGSRTVNSSPPNRPTTSDSRTCCLSSAARARSTSSPIRWPWLSLTRLKWSTSISSRASGALARTARATSASASRCHAVAFSSPVFGSVRAAAASCWCIRLRCSKMTGGSATSRSR